MYFDTPKRWILYKLMDPEKLLLPAISSLPISFLFLYLSPLFLVTHEMARCLCIWVVSSNLFEVGVCPLPPALRDMIYFEVWSPLTIDNIMVTYSLLLRADGHSERTICRYFLSSSIQSIAHGIWPLIGVAKADPLGLITQGNECRHRIWGIYLQCDMLFLDMERVVYPVVTKRTGNSEIRRPLDGR